jgi:hypothetical protein
LRQPGELPIELDLDLVLQLGLEVVRDGFVVLGSPLGTLTYVSSQIEDPVIVSSRSMIATAILEDPQCELMLLRCCSGAPNMIY